MMDNKLVQKFMHQVEEVVTSRVDRELLFEALKRYQSSSDVKRLVQDLRRVLNEPIRLEVYDYVRPLIRPQHQQTYDKITPSAPGVKSRTIKLRRRGNESFGFAVRGGFEHGIGIFVSHVEKSSQAEQRGLKMGDEIVRVNGFTIIEAIHDEVLNLIKGRDEIELKVTSIGMVPIKQNPTDPVTWQYVEKTALSKQQSVAVGQPEGAENITKIFINMHGAQSLGCSIVSGPKQFPGIYIETVRAGGLAENYQLEVGDQILEVNGKSFQDIKHKEAIVELKGSKELNMVIKKHAGLTLFNLKKGGQSPVQARKEITAADVEHHADQNRKVAPIKGKPGNVFGSYWPSADLICEVLEQDEQSDLERKHWEEEQTRIREDREIEELKRREEERRRREEERRMTEEMERQSQEDQLQFERQLEEERRRNEEERKRREEERLRQEAEQLKLEENRRKQEKKRLEEQARLEKQKQREEQRRQEDEAEREALRDRKKESAVLAGRLGARSSLKPKLLGAASLSKASFGSVQDKVIKDVIIEKSDDTSLDIEVEGGLGSPLGGKIVVADVYPGGLVDMSGEIKKGDKLLKVNNTSLVDISLTDAQEILWQAEQAPQRTIELTVEKSEFRSDDNEITYF